VKRVVIDLREEGLEVVERLQRKYGVSLAAAIRMLIREGGRALLEVRGDDKKGTNNSNK